MNDNSCPHSVLVPKSWTEIVLTKFPTAFVQSCETQECRLAFHFEGKKGKEMSPQLSARSYSNSRFILQNVGIGEEKMTWKLDQQRCTQRHSLQSSGHSCLGNQQKCATLLWQLRVPFLLRRQRLCSHLWLCGCWGSTSLRYSCSSLLMEGHLQREKTVSMS